MRTPGREKERARTEQTKPDKRGSEAAEREAGRRATDTPLVRLLLKYNDILKLNIRPFKVDYANK